MEKTKTICGIVINTHHELDLDLIRKSYPSGYLPEDPKEQEEMRIWDELPLEIKMSPEKIRQGHKIIMELLGGIPEEFLIKK